jgi:pimeloyl-ACP methyl ester carboxylesterase
MSEAMSIFDRGSGPPVVVVPGLHGRWEWARPALQRLASRCRAISYSLTGDFGSGGRLRRELGFDNYVHQLDGILERTGLTRAVLCGVSFGGFVALRYAAARPDRVAALILASAPGPGWRPNPRQAAWIARPWWSVPGFVLTSPLRLWPEVSASFPAVRRRLGFFARQGLRCLTAPMIPSLMATRIREAAHLDFEADCRRLSLPTLVLTGEEDLDRVVPVSSSRAYTRLIRRAEYQTLAQTGHLGVLTQPSAFADVVCGFAHAHYH